MYTGRIVETGPDRAVLEHPLHPYTLGLIDAIVDLDEPVGRPTPIPGSLPDLERLPWGAASTRDAFSPPRSAWSRRAAAP